MVHLFAALPAAEREKIEVNRIHDYRRLSHEWPAYVSRTHKLRKAFVSVKGIYYQMSMLQKQYHNELKMEMQGTQYSSGLDVKNKKVAEGGDVEDDSGPDLEQIADDNDKLSRPLMPRKKRRLLESIKIGKQRK